MHNIIKIFVQIGWIVLSLSVSTCRQLPNEPPPKNQELAGKALFTGPTPVKQHHGIQVIAYLKSDTTLTPIDTTFTDSTGYYCFGKPGFDGVYMLWAKYRYYYPDTVEVEAQDGAIMERPRDLYMQQMARIKFSSEKNTFHLSESFTWTVEVTNLSHDRIILPNESWFDYHPWSRLIFVSAESSKWRYYGTIGSPIGAHGPPERIYEPGETMTLTRSASFGIFADSVGKRIGPGEYLFYATESATLPLEKNGRILPIFEPVEVEIVP